MGGEGLGMLCGLQISISIVMVGVFCRRGHVQVPQVCETTRKKPGWQGRAGWPESQVDHIVCHNLPAHMCEGVRLVPCHCLKLSTQSNSRIVCLLCGAAEALCAGSLMHDASPTSTDFPVVNTLSANTHGHNPCNVLPSHLCPATGWHARTPLVLCGR